MKGKIIGIVIVVMLAITGVAGYFTYQKAEAEEKARISFPKPKSIQKRKKWLKKKMPDNLQKISL